MRRGSALAAVLVATLAACSGGAKHVATVTTTTTSTTTTSTTTTAVPTTIAPSTTTTAKAAPRTTVPKPPPTATPYAASSAPVTEAELGASWHAGCPVAVSQLRMLTLPFVGFDGAEHVGRMVVNATYAAKVITVFHKLHDARFPLRKVQPITTQAEVDDFTSSDDNSTGFTCRDAVRSDGVKAWSEHAYGRAIDVDPVENPYLSGDQIIPPAGSAYLDRGDVRPGMATPGSVVVKAFASIGWGWGGSWSSNKDYQHFSATGR